MFAGLRSLFGIKANPRIVNAVSDEPEPEQQFVIDKSEYYSQVSTGETRGEYDFSDAGLYDSFDKDRALFKESVHALNQVLSETFSTNENLYRSTKLIVDKAITNGANVIVIPPHKFKLRIPLVVYLPRTLDADNLDEYEHGGGSHTIRQQKWKAFAVSHDIRSFEAFVDIVMSTFESRVSNADARLYALNTVLDKVRLFSLKWPSVVRARLLDLELDALKKRLNDAKNTAELAGSGADKIATGVTATVAVGDHLFQAGVVAAESAVALGAVAATAGVGLIETAVFAGGTVLSVGGNIASAVSTRNALKALEASKNATTATADATEAVAQVGTDALETGAQVTETVTQVGTEAVEVGEVGLAGLDAAEMGAAALSGTGVGIVVAGAFLAADYSLKFAYSEYEEYQDAAKLIKSVRRTVTDASQVEQIAQPEYFYVWIPSDELTKQTLDQILLSDNPTYHTAPEGIGGIFISSKTAESIHLADQQYHSGWFSTPEWMETGRVHHHPTMVKQLTGEMQASFLTPEQEAAWHKTDLQILHNQQFAYHHHVEHVDLDALNATSNATHATQTMTTATYIHIPADEISPQLIQAIQDSNAPMIRQLDDGSIIVSSDAVKTFDANHQTGMSTWEYVSTWGKGNLHHTHEQLTSGTSSSDLSQKTVAMFQNQDEIARHAMQAKADAAALHYSWWDYLNPWSHVYDASTVADTTSHGAVWLDQAHMTLHVGSMHMPLLMCITMPLRIGWEAGGYRLWKARKINDDQLIESIQQDIVDQYGDVFRSIDGKSGEISSAIQNLISTAQHNTTYDHSNKEKDANAVFTESLISIVLQQIGTLHCRAFQELVLLLGKKGNLFARDSAPLWRMFHELQEAKKWEDNSIRFNTFNIRNFISRRWNWLCKFEKMFNHASQFGDIKKIAVGTKRGAPLTYRLHEKGGQAFFELEFDTELPNHQRLFDIGTLTLAAG